MKRLLVVGAVFVFFCRPALAKLAEKLDETLDHIGRPIALSQERIKIKFGLESRYRLELRNNFNFNDATNEDDAVNLFRNRLGADLTLSSFLRVLAEGQDAESFAESGLNKTNAYVDRLELRQLYGELKSPWSRIPLTLTAGRQPLAYGDQRLIGYSVWSNVSTLHDAVKAVYVPADWFQIDTWFSRRVLVTRNRINSSDHADNFYGLYTALKPLMDHVFDTFLFIRHNRNNEIVGEKPGERGSLKNIQSAIGSKEKNTVLITELNGCGNLVLAPTMTSKRGRGTTILATHLYLYRGNPIQILNTIMVLVMMILVMVIIKILIICIPQIIQNMVTWILSV